MADLKISQLANATTPLAGTETVPVVQSSTTKKVTIDDLTAGKVVPANGVKFPATQSASSDVNTLDDYEEGTWTPVLATDGTNFTSVSYNVQVGKYTKIGNQVTITGTLYTSAVNKGSASGNVIITGLPFAQPTTDARGGIFVPVVLLWGADMPYGGEVSASQINLSKRATSNGATSNLVVADVSTTDGNFMRFFGTYFV